MGLVLCWRNGALGRWVRPQRASDQLERVLTNTWNNEGPNLKLSCHDAEHIKRPNKNKICVTWREHVD